MSELLHPDRFYSVPEVAETLRLRPKTVYSIPSRVLPRHRVGPKGGRIVFRGRDVLEYLKTMRRAR